MSQDNKNIKKIKIKHQIRRLNTKFSNELKLNYQKLISTLANFKYLAVSKILTKLIRHYQQKKFKKSAKVCIPLKTILWEEMHSEKWDCVPLVLRDAYSIYTIISSLCFLTLLIVNNEKKSVNKHYKNIKLANKNVGINDLRKILKIVDMGLLMGGNKFRSHLFLLIELIEELIQFDQNKSVFLSVK